VFIFITLKFGAYLTILGLSLLVQSMIWTCLNWTSTNALYKTLVTFHQSSRGLISHIGIICSM